jgi:hypothetical protein
LPGQRFHLLRRANSEPFRETEFSGSWAARLRRYEAWFNNGLGNSWQPFMSNDRL